MAVPQCRTTTAKPQRSRLHAYTALLDFLALRFPAGEGAPLVWPAGNAAGAPPGDNTIAPATKSGWKPLSIS